MSRRLAELGVDVARTTRSGAADTTARLFAAFAGGGSGSGARASLEDEGRRRLSALRDRGFDLGVPSTLDADARVDAIHAHARRALYAVMSDAAIVDACGLVVRGRTEAADRDQYLSHPQAGERLTAETARDVAAAYHARPPRVLLVVSDGLNAEAINEQLRALVPSLRRALDDRGCAAGSHAVVVQNGRVRAGYEIGGLAGAEVVVHLIGERPGTGINSLSAYVTYGRDARGAFRWARNLDHASTTAVCGIHPRGKPPSAAVAEIATVVRRMLDRRASGVDLAKKATGPF